MIRPILLAAVTAIATTLPQLGEANEPVLSIGIDRFFNTGTAIIRYDDSNHQCPAPMEAAHIAVSADLSEHLEADPYFSQSGFQVVTVRRGTEREDIQVGAADTERFAQVFTRDDTPQLSSLNFEAEILVCIYRHRFLIQDATFSFVGEVGNFTIAISETLQTIQDTEGAHVGIGFGQSILEGKSRFGRNNMLGITGKTTSDFEGLRAIGLMNVSLNWDQYVIRRTDGRIEVMSEIDMPMNFSFYEADPIQ